MQAAECETKPMVRVVELEFRVSNFDHELSIQEAQRRKYWIHQSTRKFNVRLTVQVTLNFVSFEVLDILFCKRH